MNDLIRREDALDAIQKRADIINSVPSDFWEGLIIAYSLVQEIPSAEPERKRSEWIRHENYDECSKCHCLTSIGFNYCPHCGADMKNEFMEARDTAMSGYQKALDEINKPMQVIIPGTWTHSECPRCGESFIDYEDNDDGYIIRARSMERCPYCGQKLDWTKDENHMY